MAFSQATITDGPNISPDGTDMLVQWTSSSPAGTVFQVYQDGTLAWSGTARSVHLPMPRTRVYIQVGTVGAGEDLDDFSGSLPGFPGGGNRATLAWSGGRSLGDDIKEFRVYGGTAPGGAVSYTTPLATIPANPAGLWLDGWGMGPYGAGGYGAASIPYTWTSEPLAGGTWNFAVKAVDAAGNESTAATTSVVISAPPRPPAPNDAGLRLTYTYNSGTRVPTLAWSAAPTT